MDINYFKKEKIVAMKAKDKEAVNALNVVINKIMLAVIEKRAKNEELVEADIVKILQKTEKEIEEEKSAFEKAGRAETVATLTKQIETIKKYLPQMMSEEEIKNVILSLDDKSIPSVMKHFKANYNGKCDMKMVNTILRSL